MTHKVNRAALAAAISHRIDHLRTELEAGPTPYECLACGEEASERDGFFVLIDRETLEPFAAVSTCPKCRAAIRAGGDSVKSAMQASASFRLAAKVPWFAEKLMVAGNA